MSATQPSRQVFQHDGLTFTYADRGGSGQVFVFQHGLCADAGQTFGLVPHDPRIRLLTLDCRGHGGSACGDPALLSIATFAADLAVFIERLGVGPVILGGTSMGAALALRLAVTRPDLLHGLVLARPAWTTEAAPPNLAPYKEIGDLLATHTADAARALFKAGAASLRIAAAAPHGLAKLHALFAREPQDVTAALLRRISADGPGVSASDVSRLASPTLIVAQEGDPLHPTTHADALGRLMPAARLVHVAAKEIDRAAFTEVLQSAFADFLAVVTSARRTA